MKHLLFLSLSLVSLLGIGALSGCSADFGTVAIPTSTTPIGHLQGSVYGGQGPISGAEIFLYQTGTTGYASPSISQLTRGNNTSFDQAVGGYYVPTDVNGEFNITGDYTCAPGNANVQYYLYSIGGVTNVGGSPSLTNTTAGLVAALGACPASGSFAAKYPYIYMNEVSTVAMMYAVQGFATGAKTIGIGPSNGASTISTLAQQGLANAFLNAQQLYSITNSTPGHLANAVTPVGNGVVPQKVIDTIADIIAACINSRVNNGNVSTACATLFANATQNGQVNGGAPTDTAQAALYMAKHPGSNVTNLYALAGQGGDPFAPDLGSQPHDFTIAINYTAANVDSPNDILIDGGDNVWITNNSNSTNTMVELNNQGVQINALAETNTNYAAFDLNGNLWTTSLTQYGFPVPGTYYTYLYLINPPPSPYTNGAVGFPGGLPCPNSPCVAAATNYNSFDQPASNQNGPNASYDSTSFSVPNGVYADKTGTYVASAGGTSTGGLGILGPVQWNSSYNGIQNVQFIFPGATFATPTTNLALWMTSPQNGGTICYINEQGYSGSLGSAYCGNGAGGGPSGYTNTGTSTTVQTPGRITTSANNGIWVASQGQNTLYDLSYQGSFGITVQSSSTGGGLSGPFGVAVDGNNTIWVANTLANSVSAFNFNGSTLTPSGLNPTYFCGGTSPCTTSEFHYNLALDNSGDIWLANTGTVNITEIIGVGAPTITPIVQGIAVGGGYVGNVP